MLIDQVTTAVNEQVDIATITNDLFDGIEQLDLPPRALAAIDLLRTPAIQGVEGLIDQTVTRVVESDQFEDVWDAALRASHRGLVAAATGGESRGRRHHRRGRRRHPARPDRRRGEAAARRPRRRLRLRHPRGEPHDRRRAERFARHDPRRLQPRRHPGLVASRHHADLLHRRHRVRAPQDDGGARVGRRPGARRPGPRDRAGGRVHRRSASPRRTSGCSSGALTAIYEQVVGAMRQTAIVLTVLGIVIAVFAWTQGRWAGSVATRRAIGGINDSIRGTLAERGVTRADSVRWMDRQRVLVRIIIAVLAVIWLWLLRPLGVGEIFLVVIVALIVWWLCELVAPAVGRACVVVADGSVDAEELERVGQAPPGGGALDVVDQREVVRLSPAGRSPTGCPPRRPSRGHRRGRRTSSSFRRRRSTARPASAVVWMSTSAPHSVVTVPTTVPAGTDGNDCSEASSRHRGRGMRRAGPRRPAGRAPTRRGGRESRRSRCSWPTAGSSRRGACRS